MAVPSPTFDPPPPYPGPSSAFALPPYETATALDTWWDSSCLPPYQSRTGKRYHPYMRILPVHRGYIPHQEKSFEEFYRSLQASADRRAAASHDVGGPALAVSLPPGTVRPPVEHFANHTPHPPPHSPVQGPGLDPEERRRRLIDHLFLLPEIIRIVRAGLGAALRAAEARF